MLPRIYLSAPHMSGDEQIYIKTAFDTNWVAPLGPNVEGFEHEFCQAVGCAHALAVSSGTAALHLALQLLGVNRGDEVLVSSFTFAASVNPILYLGGYPTFIDSELASWNMNPQLLENVMHERAREGKMPKAVIVVHLYGQSADMNPILAICNRFDVPVIEDAAEALGATYRGRMVGTLGRYGVFSFNGNKIITTSGGGMLVTNESDEDGALIARARKLATQAREPAPHYQHNEIGYNYRMSNILAGIGRGQLKVLNDRVQKRREVFDYYVERLGDLPGISFMPEASWGQSNRWLTCMIINPECFGADREEIRLALEAENIESRPLWKPMHLQPVFEKYESVGGDVSRNLFENGLCLPSGSNMSDADLARIVNVIRGLYRQNHGHV